MLAEQDTQRIRLIEIMLAVGTFVSIVATLSFTPSDYVLELVFGVILAIFIVAVLQCYVNYVFKARIRTGLWHRVMTVSFGWLVMFPIISFIIDVIIRDHESFSGILISILLSGGISFLIGGLWFGLFLANFFVE